MNQIQFLEKKDSHTKRGGLINFIRDFWPIVEPSRPFVEGWPLYAICEHLEAITFGDIRRLLMNVPPGFMKSLTSNVFFPAWEWGPMEMPSLRYIAASYSQSLTLRDNIRFRNIIMSPQYREMYGDIFGPSQDQFNLVKVANDKTGWKLATSVAGIGTGERGDRFIIDDGNNVKESESKTVTDSTNQWFTEVVPTRLNDASTGAIINIQQRTNEADISGTILEMGLPYEHLMIPMEYEEGRHCATSIGWTDPRKTDGELAWPERFDADAVADLKQILKSYATAGQLQQRPAPRGGGLFKEDYWVPWDKADFPNFEYIVASLDPAFSEQNVKNNDPSGFSVWGVFEDQNKNPAVMCMMAWRKWLDLHGPYQDRKPDETQGAYLARTREAWGLVEQVAHDCRRLRVHRLLIEAKATGISVAQEMRRLFSNQNMTVELVNPKGDKMARAMSVQPIFSDGQVWIPMYMAPDFTQKRAWAELIVDEMSAFPKGKFDDVVDSASQALRHLRDAGLLIRREERRAYEAALAKPQTQLAPLYPA